MAQTKTTETKVVKTSVSEAAGYETYVASAYCLQGKMSNGQRVSSFSAAVDPRYIPLGSTLEIIGLGTYKASDTGGAIKGKRLDLWFSSCKAAMKFGKRVVRVKITRKLIKKT